MLPFVLAGMSALAVDPSVPDDPGQDPLAPAQSGMVQCYDPNRSGHTCLSIAAYRRDRGGAWTMIATIMPDPAQPLTLEVETPATVRDGMVCSTFRRDQFMVAKLRYFDRPIPADRAIPVLAQIAGSMAGAFDHELCTRFVPVPGGLVARARMAGASAAFPDQRVIWVRADAGFHVQPRTPAGAGG